MKVEDLRRNYMFGSLTRASLPHNPVDLFSQWFSQLESAGLPEWFELNAMTLSTTAIHGGSSSRIVLLKGFDDSGFRFFTNYESSKGQQISNNPRVALNFFWPIVERQVRIEGVAIKTSDSLSDQYFASRPRSSQLGASVSPQSQVIPDDHELADRVDELDKEWQDQTIPRPNHWGGYNVAPTMIEFWQGRPSRLHDRFRYRRDNENDIWTIERIAP